MGATTILIQKPLLNKKEQDKLVRKQCLETAEQFPGLSAAGFFSEVSHCFYPRIDESDIKGMVLQMVRDGELVYTNDWKVKLAKAEEVLKLLDKQ